MASAPTELASDGSSVADAPAEVTIDLTDDIDRMRYRCPSAGRHANWDLTNSHIWCASCAQLAQHNDEIDPEYYEILDARTGETIPWSAVEVEM